MSLVEQRYFRRAQLGEGILGTWVIKKDSVLNDTGLMASWTQRGCEVSESTALGFSKR